MRRRQFLKNSAGAGLVLSTSLPSLCADLSAFGGVPRLSRIEARYYDKLPDREIECLLCPRRCRLGDKERGYCGVRENQEGTYYSLVYGKACSVNVDPIEKKPFFHFLPGSDAFSLATAGCNVNCKFCQNWQISQVRPEQVDSIDLPPEAAVAAAVKYRCPSIAYTYTEPVVFFEYMIDTCREARKKGIRNAVVTGGHISRKPLLELVETAEALKIDLKGFSQEFYSEYVRGDLHSVLEAIRIVAKSKAWLEIVYLLIPSLNDDAALIRSMCRWLLSEAGADVPLHFSRFQPMYLIKNLPPTPVSSLEKARRIAIEEGLRFVYIGNVPGHEAENTFCPRCGKIVIQRTGYAVQRNAVKAGTCGFCAAPIPGLWS